MFGRFINVALALLVGAKPELEPHQYFYLNTASEL
jgi:hypothetical protein